MTNYFDSLSEVREEISTRLLAAKAELVQPDFFSDSMNSFVSGCNYGYQVRENAALARLKGKPTCQFAHAIVERLASGRYELVFYIL